MKKTKARKSLWRWRVVALLALVAALAFVCSRWWYQLVLIQGDSMLPTYRNFHLAILDKHTRDYVPGDVIAFRCEGLRSVLIKRVAAGPGDEAQIVGGTLFVNGAISPVYPQEGLFQFAGLLEEALALGEGEYLVLGDNAAQSKDSRYAEVGVVREEAIIGEIPRARHFRTDRGR